jgi:hypothetical protein
MDFAAGFVAITLAREVSAARISSERCTLAKRIVFIALAFALP